MPILTKLKEYLDSHQVRYEVLAHRQAFTAQETAQAQHVHGRQMAKVVIVHSGPEFAMVVLPAPSLVDLARAGAVLGKRDVTLATEGQFTSLFPGCEPGAMPPFGNLYGLPVVVDRELARDEQIVFNAGNHTEAVRMRYTEFERLAAPELLWLSYVM